MKYNCESIRIKFLAVIFIGLFALNANAQSYEDEIREILKKQTEGWNSADIETINSDSISVGFGFRSLVPRTSAGRTAEVDRKILQLFFNSLESYKIIPGERNIVIDGNIALVWGSHVEEIKHVGQPSERVNVRGTATYKRNSDGTWKALLSHRDIQKFDENGQYVREFFQ